LEACFLRKHVTCNLAQMDQDTDLQRLCIFP